MAKINFKKIILTVATLAALAGTIKWFGDYQADKNFKKLPKQQQVYVDSLMHSGSISPDKIRDDISKLNRVGGYLRYLDDYIKSIEEGIKNINAHKHSMEKRDFQANRGINIRPRVNAAKEELIIIRSNIRKIQIFDMREIQIEIEEIGERITQLENWLKSN